MGIYLLLCKLYVIHVHALIIIKDNINRMHNIITGVLISPWPDQEGNKLQRSDLRVA